MKLLFGAIIISVDLFQCHSRRQRCVKESDSNSYYWYFQVGGGGRDLKST